MTDLAASLRGAARRAERTAVRGARPFVPARTRRLIRTAPRRARLVGSYRAWRRSPLLALRYLLTDPEIDNFTYSIANTDELASFLAAALGANVDEIAASIRELRADGPLRGEIEDRLVSRPDRRRTMPYGRRLGWYAVARHLKPGVAIETGVHDGLGSAVLLRALARNEVDGVAGTLISIDIRSGVGWLIPPRLRRHHDVRIGDSLGILRSVGPNRPVDLFIHDSDHRYEHETNEFETILPFTRARLDPHVRQRPREHGVRGLLWPPRPRLPLLARGPARALLSGAGIGLAVVTADALGR